MMSSITGIMKFSFFTITLMLATSFMTMTMTMTTPVSAMPSNLTLADGCLQLSQSTKLDAWISECTGWYDTCFLWKNVDCTGEGSIWIDNSLSCYNPGYVIKSISCAGD
ncbi:hypothetical protein LTR67_002162 [Exophiala xenobiotica]